MPKSNGEIISRNFADIFSGEMRYVIPFFQRGYVWGSRNWNQLKQDLEEQVLDPAQNGGLAEQEHFFGPVVVAEQSGDPRFKIFDIIDGQQRFTTVYLMLAYFRRRLETLLSKAPKAREHYDTTGQWLINRTDERQARDDYWRIKLFSVKGDRLATYYSVFGKNRNPATPTLQEDLYLYLPNGNNISDKFERWMGRNFGDMGDEGIWRWLDQSLDRVPQSCLDTARQSGRSAGDARSDSPASFSKKWATIWRPREMVSCRTTPRPYDTGGARAHRRRRMGVVGGVILMTVHSRGSP